MWIKDFLRADARGTLCDLSRRACPGRPRPVQELRDLFATSTVGTVGNRQPLAPVVDGAWKTRRIRGRAPGLYVDKPIAGLLGGPYVSSCPEGTIKGTEARDSIKGIGSGSATGDSIKGGPRGYRGSAPRPGH